MGPVLGSPVRQWSRGVSPPPVHMRPPVNAGQKAGHRPRTNPTPSESGVGGGRVPPPGPKPAPSPPAPQHGTPSASPSACVCVPWTTRDPKAPTVAAHVGGGYGRATPRQTPLVCRPGCSHCGTPTGVPRRRRRTPTWSRCLQRCSRKPWCPSLVLSVPDVSCCCTNHLGRLGRLDRSAMGMMPHTAPVA